MGKKRERPFESAPKRRTKLQIGSASSSKKDGGGTGVFGSTFQEASRSQSDHNPLSGLLGQYGDSDDEDSQDNPQRDTDDANKPKNEIDAKVADFLAEIDALDGFDSPGPSGETSEALPKQTADAPPQNNSHIDSTLSQAVESTSDVTSAPSGYVDPEHGMADSTNNEAGELGEWQELLDEATNCVYYWNTVTSEVTWEIPAALQAANQQLAGQSYEHQLANGTTAQDSEVAEPVVASENVAVQQEEFTKEDSMSEILPVTNEHILDKETRKLPVYGPGAVEYDVSPEPEIEEEEFELQKPEAKKTMYPMFVKGDILPGSENIVADTKEVEASSEESSSAIGQGKPVLMEDEAESTNGNGESRPDDDDMDIDEQLEMALERRKAELKQLELNDGTSSPCSADKKRKAPEPLDLYDEKGEVNLLAIKKKRIENLRSSRKSTVETNDIGTQCDAELEDLAAKKKTKEEAEMKKEIAELSLDLNNKLAFLGITTAELTKFQIMLIEKEVRVRDWREGLLDSKHLLRHLKSADWELQRYEMEATPSGWSCSWDREHKQYYYTNNETGMSQWDFPMDAVTLNESKGEEAPESSETQMESQSLFNQASLMEGTEHGQYVLATPLVPAVQDTNQSQAYIAYSAPSSITEPQAVEYATPYIPQIPPNPAPPKTQAPPLPAPSLPDPVPPPSVTPSQPNPPLPSSYHKPPPPPPGTELFPPLPDSPPPPLPSGSGPELPPLPSSPPPPPPPEEDDEGACDSTRTMTPPPLPMQHLTPDLMVGVAGDVPSSSATPSASSSSMVIGKPQLLYSGSAAMADTNYSAAVLYSALPSVAAAPQGASLPSGMPTTGAQQVTGKTKKKKEKTKKSTSKKNKLPLSLVQKWQQIKEEVEREENANDEEEDEEDDPNVVTQKRIEQWKREQLAAGLSTKNANFEMIQGDWRERLKRKSNPSS